MQPIIDGDAACSPLDIVPWSGGGTGSVDVNSGNCNFGSALNVATWGDFDSSILGPGILYVHGGTVTTQSDGSAGLVIGSQFGPTAGRVIMYGGLINVPRLSLYNGDIDLYGGTLQSDGNFVFAQTHPENKINVNGGTLRIAGNWMNSDPNIPGLMANGRIISRRGGALSAPFFDGTYTVITGTGDFNCAWNPIPDINATNVHYYNGTDTNSVTLTWNRGEPNVVEHYVYFGTSYTDVYTATTASSQFQHLFTDANQGDPCSWVVSGTFFTPGASYYWRVDENSVTSLNDDGSPKTFLTTPGLVWKFTAHDGNAVNIQPLNGQIGLKEPLALTWTKGDWASGPGDANALGHRVFFGTNSSAVGNAWNTSTNGTYRGTVSSPVYPLSRLTETGPNPPGASWVLTPGVTCYWRIDEVNTTTGKVYGGKSGFGGNIWNFTPSGAITIEDFEDYNNTADMNANWKKSGLCPGLSFVAFGAMNYLIDGTAGKHGSFAYNNTAVDTCQPFSEVNRPYIGGTVFTGSNILNPQPAVIRVDYVGLVTNSGSYDEGHEHPLDTLYVALEDTAGNVGVYYNTDPNAVQATTWKQWYIPLNDPNFSGVTMTAISNFYLGVGLRCNDGGHGSTGTVMFDNIRLYAKTCNPNPPFDLTADMDGDCDVDVNDLDVFANDWLAKAHTYTFAITAPQAPVLWYKFNDGTGTSITDYGKTGSYTGTVLSLSSHGWDTTGGRDANHLVCLNLLSGQNSYVSCPTSALSFMSDANHSGPDGGSVTFSAWVKADVMAPEFQNWGEFILIANSANTEAMEISCPYHNFGTWGWAGWAKGGSPGWSWGPAAPLSDFGIHWNHWVWVKEPHAISFYCNGNLIGHEADTDANMNPGDDAHIYGPLFTPPATNFTIGTRWWAWWAGRINDFQVYDYALSAAEIDYLATDGTGSIMVPLASNANFNLNGGTAGDANQIVNFEDLSIMGDQWHQLKLWP
jgi:hypothetical protein